MPNTLRDFGMYAKQGLKHPFTTATWMPPREEFLDKVADAYPQKIEAMLHLGIGGGLLMQKILHERDQLHPNGVYLAVDCDKSWIEYIRQYRPDVANDPRVHFILKYAQHAREEIEHILEQKKIAGIDASLWTIPSTQMEKRDVAKVMKDTAELSVTGATAIAYNVGSTEHLLGKNWNEVSRLMKDYGANYGVPFLAFDTWMAKNPVAQREVVTANGYSHGSNGKLPHLNGHAKTLNGKAPSFLKRFLEKWRR